MKGFLLKPIARNVLRAVKTLNPLALLKGSSEPFNRHSVKVNARYSEGRNGILSSAVTHIAFVAIAIGSLYIVRGDDELRVTYDEESGEMRIETKLEEAPVVEQTGEETRISVPATPELEIDGEENSDVISD